MSNRALVLVAAVAVLWGIPYLFIAVALEELSPAVIAFARTGLAAAILLPLALAAGALAGLRERWAWLVVLAATQMAGPFLLLGFAEERISSSLTGILVSATPLLVALVALGVDRSESASGSRLVGLGVGLAGVALLLGLDVGRDAGALVGALAALGTALGYAISALLLKARFTGCDGRGVVGATTALAAVLLLPAALGTFPGAAPSGDALGSLVVLGIASTAGGFLLFFRLQAEIGPGRASVVAYLAPGVAVVLGVAFLDDPFGPATVAGLGLILLGSFLAGRRAGARLRLRPAGSTSAP
ncbi:MAG TPA: DMT family transporter [Gaiellaceae bacterium]|nr:DMT family transporter [Gaiellaceae bacterium]